MSKNSTKANVEQLMSWLETFKKKPVKKTRQRKSRLDYYKQKGA